MLTSCNGKENKPLYCENLQNKINNPKVLYKLEQWYDFNFTGKRLSNEKYIFGGQFMPGSYTYKGQFDWNLINFDEKRAIIKIIKYSSIIRDEQKEIDVKSVSLAERSRMSIVIKSLDSIDYGVGTDKKFLIKVSERVAIFCMDVGF